MEKIRNLTKGNFARSVIVLTGGAVFAQVINFIISPIITRIYSPVDYGILTVYNAVLGIVSMMGALTYEQAIPIGDDDERAINIFALCITILTTITIVITALLFFFGENLLGLLNAKTILKYKYFIPIGFFSIGLYMIVTGWAFRKKNFKSIAKTKYSQSIVGNATKIGLGLLSFGPIGLILGRIFAESAGVFNLLSAMIQGDENIFKKINIKTMVYVAKRYVKFPLFSAPTMLLTSLSTQIPIILMSTIYGSKVVGLYGIAITVTYMPATLIGRSIEDVFYGESASLSYKNPIRIKELSDKLMLKLILLAGIPMLILIAFGPQLFSIVFGSVWREAGVYSRLITVATFSYFIFQPSSTIFIVFEEQRQLFFLNIVKLILVAVLFQVIRINNLDSYTAILTLSLIMAILDVFKYLMAQKILNDAINTED